jgi:hypothetical protein
MRSDADAPSRAHRLGAAFCALEALGGIAWWLAMAWMPPVRDAFFPAPGDARWFGALALADGLLFVGSALVASIALHRRARWSAQALWAHSGITAYGGLLAVGLWLEDPTLWLGAVLMLPSMVVPPLLAQRLADA